MEERIFGTGFKSGVRE